MAGEKEPRKRTAFGPHYCPEDLLSEVNAIPEIASAITGTEKVYAIKKSFDFFHEWKDKVSNLGEGASDEKLAEKDAKIAELEEQLSQKEKELANAQNATDSEKDARIAELEEQLSQKETELANAQNATDSEKDARIAELESQLEAASKGKPTWEQIRKTIDPVYAEMMEYMSRELGQDDPLRMAIDIFVKYHVHRYTELPFQPFIPEHVIDEIVRSVYPGKGGIKELRKALK